MQTDCPSSAQFLTIEDEGLKAFNMSVLGATNDYQWKEFQGSVQLQTSVFQELSRFETTDTLRKCWPSRAGSIPSVKNNDISAYD